MGRWEQRLEIRSLVPVYEWAERQRKTQRQQKVTHSLVGQFLDFLDAAELGPFRGFRDEDFEFFRNPTAEQRPVVKNRLAALGEVVVELLADHEREAMGAIHVGQLGEDVDHAWLPPTRMRMS